ncbi:hypothetical protein MYSTI_03788 [Myxococcus stipitatus DSM 14675]|uniref:Uncharacterized protein n=1 Tax=Myxococcus stipitatus (strain DSM 14675 / JCM 12634 / Mx s8) TaxID=1278073 RepID=L7UF70_MYXSD|nr:hypothetical protein MYSTI_03788 [Myxococcus stipitatus DSM 14675]
MRFMLCSKACRSEPVIAPDGAGALASPMGARGFSGVEGAWLAVRTSGGRGASEGAFDAVIDGGGGGLAGSLGRQAESVLPTANAHTTPVTAKGFRLIHCLQVQEGIAGESDSNPWRKVPETSPCHGGDVWRGGVPRGCVASGLRGLCAGGASLGKRQGAAGVLPECVEPMARREQLQ